jgi:hypothetical protein
MLGQDSANLPDVQASQSRNLMLAVAISGESTNALLKLLAIERADQRLALKLGEDTALRADGHDAAHPCEQPRSGLRPGRSKKETPGGSMRELKSA